MWIVSNLFLVICTALKGLLFVLASIASLCRYLDEQAYRYNNRKLDDGERFDLAIRQIVGKRLKWDQRTGKAVECRPSIN